MEYINKVSIKRYVELKEKNKDKKVPTKIKYVVITTFLTTYVWALIRMVESMIIEESVGAFGGVLGILAYSVLWVITYTIISRYHKIEDKNNKYSLIKGLNDVYKIPEVGAYLGIDLVDINKSTTQYLYLDLPRGTKNLTENKIIGVGEGLENKVEEMYLKEECLSKEKLIQRVESAYKILKYEEDKKVEEELRKITKNKKEETPYYRTMKEKKETLDRDIERLEDKKKLLLKENDKLAEGLKYNIKE